MLKENALLIAQLIQSVGGKLVGRIRLQKTLYVLQAAGLKSGLVYQYYHYGPYCEEVANAADYGAAIGLFNEKEINTEWGTTYSVYTITDKNTQNTLSEEFIQLAREAINSSSVVLELAATALYLYKEEHIQNAWKETAIRKPQKAKDGRIESAKSLYKKFMQICPQLPNIS